MFLKKSKISPISRSLPQSQSLPPLEPVQLVHQFINRRIRCLDLPGQQRLVLLKPCVLHLFIQVEHLCHERDHAVVPGFVGGVGEVDSADGELLDVLSPKPDISSSQRGPNLC